MGPIKGPNPVKIQVPMRKSLAALLLLLIALPCVQAAGDPFWGAWVMDVKKSKYPPGVPLPKAMRVTMEAPPDGSEGVHYKSEIEYQDGKKSETEYTNDYTGVARVVVTNRGFTTPVALERPDLNTVVATYARGKDVLATSRRVVSKDGRTMTITTTSNDKSNKRVVTIGHYVRADRKP